MKSLINNFHITDQKRNFSISQHTRIFTLLFLFVLLAHNSYCQTAIGDGNWSNPNNWSCNCVPSATDDVTLDGYELIVDSVFSVRSVSYIFSGDTLTIDTNGVLNVINAQSYGMQKIHIINYGELNISNTMDDAIFQGGLTNYGTTNIGPNINGDGIYTYCCSGDFFDVTNYGNLSFDSTSGHGINTIQSQSTKNYGTLNFTNIGSSAIYIGAVNNTSNPNELYNYTDGVINIDNSGDILIRNATIGANYGQINISNTAASRAVALDGAWNNGFPSWNNESSGIINFSNVEQTINVGGGETFYNYGKIDLVNVTSGFAGGGAKINEGIISGGGRIAVGRNHNNGLIAPGTSSSADTLDIYVGSNSILTTLDSIGSIIELNIFDVGTPGIDYDHFSLKNKSIPLRGTLSVVLDVGYVPSDGDCFELISAAQSIATQEFDNLSLPDISPFDWELSYNALTVDLCVITIPCIDTLSISNTITTGDYQAQSLIESDGFVPNGSAVSFKAGQEIYLKLGFESEENTDLHLEIEDCP